MSEPKRPSVTETEDDLLALQREFVAVKSTPSASIVRCIKTDKPTTTHDVNMTPTSSDDMSSMSQLKRPRPAETEDDLLAFQNEFFAVKSQQAASVVRCSKTSKPSEKRDVVNMGGLPEQLPQTEVVPPKKKSKFKTTRQNKDDARRFEAYQALEDGLDPETRLDEHDKSVPAILSKIIERDTRQVPVFQPRATKQGFPMVFHRDTQPSTTTSSGPQMQKKPSLFAQHFLHMPKSDGSVPESGEPSLIPPAISKGLQGHSVLVDGSGLGRTRQTEADQIHTENVSRMQAMSEKQILEEQQKLLEMIDPKLVEFLKSKKSSVAPVEETMDVEKRSLVEEIPTKTEPSTGLSFQPDPDWVNMDKIEHEKLAWMSELPPPKVDNKQTGQQARFDFHGNLVAPEANLPVTLGLHHHGDEPERAGYSLEELFQLCRSSNIQQRTLALKTLAHIINKAKDGTLDGALQTAILPSLLDAGVIFLVRWALDDSVDGVLAAAVSVLHALVVSQADELCLDQSFFWPDGTELSCQSPAASQSESQNDDGEESDADFIKRDVILGLVARMTILPRLRYILESCHLQAPPTIHVLEILTRIARHSISTSYQMMQCAGLIEMVMKNFLPPSWQPVVTSWLSSLYGSPVPAAIKFIRTLCQAGRNMAAILIDRYQLMSSILMYIAPKPSELGLPESEAYCVQTESFKLWRVLMLYGFAAENYLDMYSSLIERLQSIQSRLTTDSPIPEHEHTLHTAMMSVIEAAIHTAACSKRYRSDFSESSRTIPTEQNMAQPSAQSPVLNWSHVAGLKHPIEMLVRLTGDDIRDSYQNKKPELSFATSCLSALTAFYTRWPTQPGYNSVEVLQYLETFCGDALCPLMNSFGFQCIVGALCDHSNLVNAGIVSPEHAANLPDLGCRCGSNGSIYPPSLKPHTPFPFLSSVCKLVYRICVIHKGLISKLTPLIVDNSDIISYAKRIVTHKQSSLRHHPFSRCENRFHYWLLRIVRFMPCESRSLYHELSLRLLSRLQPGDEHIAHHLLSTTTFNEQLIPEGNAMTLTEATLEQMKLSDIQYLTSATTEQIAVQGRQLLECAVKNLASIRATYIGSFASAAKAVERSKNRLENNVFVVETFFLTNHGEALLPVDWMFLPIVTAYDEAQDSKTQSTESTPPATVQNVINCLQWVHLLETWRPDLMTSISIATRLSRIMCIFLTGTNLFLESSIQHYLATLLKQYTRPQCLDQMDFTQSIPGVVSFYELYMILLEQFLSVSFADALFACFILVPMQQKHAIELRRSVWGEHSQALRILTLPLQQLLIPVDRYLHPDEMDPPLVRMYCQALLSEAVTSRRTPVPYLIAVHHTNRFIYANDGRHVKLKQLILQQILALRKQELQHHILHYKMADLQQTHGMQLYTELPQTRQSLIDSVQKQRSKTEMENT